jgi:hypothetical protein
MVSVCEVGRPGGESGIQVTVDNVVVTVACDETGDVGGVGAGHVRLRLPAGECILAYVRVRVRVWVGVLRVRGAPRKESGGVYGIQEGRESV